MSLQNDPRYFPQADVPTNGNYNTNFGKEQLYQAYLPRSAEVDTANAAAGEKTGSNGRYTFDPATGQYTWVPAKAADAATGIPTDPYAGQKGGGGRGIGDASGYGQGFTGSTTDGSPSTGAASMANSAAAALGNLGFTGISNALASQVSPNYGNEGRNAGNAPSPGSSAAGSVGGYGGNPNAGSAAASGAVGGYGPGTSGFNGGMGSGEGGSGGGDKGDNSGRDSSHGDPTGNSGGAAKGGLMALASGGLGDLGGYSDGGRLLRGPGDGVSDSIPANIGGKRPARLADNEFVIPARIVSELGNGSTEAGARRLYAMLDRIQEGRKKSIGKGKVAVDTKAYKHLPA